LKVRTTKALYSDRSWQTFQTISNEPPLAGQGLHKPPRIRVRQLRDIFKVWWAKVIVSKVFCGWLRPLYLNTSITWTPVYVFCETAAPKNYPFIWARYYLQSRENCSTL